MANVDIRITARDLTQRAFQNLNRNIQQTNAGLQQANSASRRLATNVRVAVTAFAGFGAAIGIRKAIDSVIEFEKQLASVRALTNATASEFASLTSQARRLGASTAFTATQVGQAQELLAKAGLNTTQVLQSTEATLNLAAAGALNLGDAADIATNVMTAFNKQASELNGIVDLIAATANKSNQNVFQFGTAISFVGAVAESTNTSIEETSAAIATLANAGIQGSRGGTSLRRVLASLAAPTVPATRRLKGLGAEMEILTDTSVPLADKLNELVRVGLDASNAFDIFGDRGAVAALILAENVELFERLNRELAAGNVEGFAERLQNIRLDTLAGDLVQAQSALEGLFISFADSSGALNAARTVIQGITTAFRALTAEAPRLIDFGGDIEGFAEATLAFEESRSTILAIRAAFIALGSVVALAVAPALAGAALTATAFIKALVFSRLATIGTVLGTVAAGIHSVSLAFIAATASANGFTASVVAGLAVIRTAFIATSAAILATPLGRLLAAGVIVGTFIVNIVSSDDDDALSPEQIRNQGLEDLAREQADKYRDDFISAVQGNPILIDLAEVVQSGGDQGVIRAARQLVDRLEVPNQKAKEILKSTREVLRSTEAVSVEALRASRDSAIGSEAAISSDLLKIDSLTKALGSLIEAEQARLDVSGDQPTEEEEAYATQLTLTLKALKAQELELKKQESGLKAVQKSLTTQVARQEAVVESTGEMTTALRELDKALVDFTSSNKLQELQGDFENTQFRFLQDRDFNGALNNILEFERAKTEVALEEASKRRQIAQEEFDTRAGDTEDSFDPADLQRRITLFRKLARSQVEAAEAESTALTAAVQTIEEALRNSEKRVENLRRATRRFIQSVESSVDERRRALRDVSPERAAREDIRTAATTTAQAQLVRPQNLADLEEQNRQLERSNALLESVRNSEDVSERTRRRATRELERNLSVQDRIAAKAKTFQVTEERAAEATRKKAEDQVRAFDARNAALTENISLLTQQLSGLTELDTTATAEQVKGVLDELVSSTQQAFATISATELNLNATVDGDRLNKDIQSSLDRGDLKATVTLNTRIAPSAVISRAEGGAIRGPGTGTSDSIMARVSNGEYVVRAASVKKFGVSLFDRLNRGVTPAFADGGLVGAGDPGINSAALTRDQVDVNLNVGGQRIGLLGERNEVNRLVNTLKRIG